MFKRRLVLFILFCTTLLSSMSLILILRYYDPYTNKLLALSFIVGSFLLSVTSIFSLSFYFIKKIYYRGEVGLYHIRSSVRQAVFLGGTFLSTFVFFYFNIPVVFPTILVGVIFILLEFLIQGM